MKIETNKRFPDLSEKLNTRKCEIISGIESSEHGKLFFTFEGLITSQDILYLKLRFISVTKIDNILRKEENLVEWANLLEKKFPIKPRYSDWDQT